MSESQQTVNKRIHRRNLSDYSLIAKKEDNEDNTECYNPEPKLKRTASYDETESWNTISHSFTSAYHKAEDFLNNMIDRGWYLVKHSHLPNWLKDNEYLVQGHRPQLSSFSACFRSIFRMHTETLNIWTHLIGFLAFLFLAVQFIIEPSIDLDWQEKAIVSVFFASAILALLFSWLFHTLYCHSECVGRFFNKLDYAGIAILTVGSFVPWLHYSFYCHPTYKVIYLISVMILGGLCIFVSVQDYFQKPHYRKLRAGLFVALGLSGVVPCAHYIVIEGFWRAYDGLFWLFVMGLCYLIGAFLYAIRFPECVFPGRVDIWFHSHQIFHVLVVVAALVHYKGILHVAEYRLIHGPCRI